MENTIKAKAIVKVTTECGYWLLSEIRGLKEGTILDGRYNPRNKAFDFFIQRAGLHAVDRPKRGTANKNMNLKAH